MMKSQLKFFLKITIQLLVLFLFALRSTFFRKPSSSKAYFHFGITPSSEAFDENVAPKHDDVVAPPPEITPECHQASPTQEALHNYDKRKDDVYRKSESSNMDIGSSD
ncbi:unnamed protein product [Lactuca saligna]|uniref:Uncharacterized protein n=1 Tax=Lactuca saligna TaxID=75948 RepID=A0AA35YXU4_LACSI|nr:unnamed protein product [Lactuca saligna]